MDMIHCARLRWVPGTAARARAAGRYAPEANEAVTGGAGEG
jgi:hypothetical protein